MKTEPSRGTKKKTKARALTSTPAKTAVPAARTPQSVPPCDDLHILIAKRAYELYSERGYRHGYAIDDWLDAEREILSRLPPT